MMSKLETNIATLDDNKNIQQRQKQVSRYIRGIMDKLEQRQKNASFIEYIPVYSVQDLEDALSNNQSK